MPHFTVHLNEEDLDGKAEPRLIRALTDAVAAVLGGWAREAADIMLFGIPRHRWGVGGTPAAGTAAPVVTLNLREGALTHPQISDAPARLIASITDAVAEVMGEAVRERVTVVLVGVPAGRSGVGGEVV